MNKLLQSIGPAVIVAAVVLGPGSILTSSKVGASLGLLGIPVVLIAVGLLIAMTALSARLGAVYQGSLCDELASRLGRPVTVAVGAILFTLVALFQSSNNLALIGGVEPLLSEKPLSFLGQASCLVAVNVLCIACLYVMRDLYRVIENAMKILVGLMGLAFVINFFVVLMRPKNLQVALPEGEVNLLPLMGLVGTTFSVAGAFYQAYLVKEKGWGVQDVKKAFADSVISISVLGGVTGIILLTSWMVFYGQSPAAELTSLSQVARQLEPSFGPAAKIVFCVGILAGALSSFLVNALIGGTVMADSLGKGSRLQDRWSLHLTTLALLVGMFVGIAISYNQGGKVYFITLAQAMTVLGLPALALAMIYLGVQKKREGETAISSGLIGWAIVGFIISCILAYLTLGKVYGNIAEWLAK